MGEAAIAVDTTVLTVDQEFKTLIPPLRLDEIVELESSILQDGCRDPLTIWGNIIVDGHNRFDICQRREIAFNTVSKEFAGRIDAMIWIRRNQLARRNLTDDQRSINAERLRQLESQKARSGQAKQAVKQREIKAGRAGVEIVSDDVADTIKQPKRDTRKETAEATGLPERKLKGAALVVKNRPDLADKVEQGEIKLADAVREIKRDEIVASLESVDAREQKALAGIYDVIVIDPPWPMQKIERDVAPNQVAFEYPTMEEGELAGLQMPAADDCHMWLWTTHKFLPMALRLCETWGFKYVCTFVWHKPDRGDFSIRSKTLFSGTVINGEMVKCELDKLKDGHGNCYFYGFLTQAQNEIAEYMIVDMNRFRRHLDDGVDIPNKCPRTGEPDGTAGRYFKFKQVVESGALVYSTWDEVAAA